MEWKNVTSVQTTSYMCLVWIYLNASESTMQPSGGEMRYENEFHVPPRRWLRCDFFLPILHYAFEKILINPNCIVTELENRDLNASRNSFQQHINSKPILCWTISIPREWNGFSHVKMPFEMHFVDGYFNDFYILCRNEHIWWLRQNFPWWKSFEDLRVS